MWSWALKFRAATAPEIEKLIGPLENMLALRTDLSGDPSFVDLLARVSDVVDTAFPSGCSF